mgnify:FL=1
MTEFSLVESPSSIALGWIGQHPDVWKEDVGMLRAYRDAVLKDNGKLSVTYKRKGLGRYYPDLPGIKSATTQWRKVRSTLFHEDHIDLDIINCHPRICKYLLENAGVTVPDTLVQYCDNRELWLQNQELDAGTAKQLFCALINGGRLSSSSIREGAEISQGWSPSDPWLVAEDELMVALTQLFVHRQTKELLFDLFLANPKVQNTVLHKAMAHVYQYYETQHMLQVMLELGGKGVRFSAYAYDGMIISKKHLPIIQRWISEGCPCDSLLADCLQFAIKPFGECLQEPEYEFSNEEFLKLAQPDSNDTAGCKEAQRRCKTYFERFHSLDITSTEIVQQIGVSKYQRFSIAASSTIFQPLQYPSEIVKEQVKWSKWMTFWLQDSRRRQTNGTDFAPPPRVCRPGALNLWGGFGIETHPSPAVKLCTSVIKDHLLFLCDESQEGVDYMLKWMASIVQHPGKPTGVCPVFIGAQGSGKSEFLRSLMQGIIGKTGCKVTGSFDGIWGKFNMRAGKTMVICDEMEGLQAHQNANLMKESITETEVRCEQKCRDAYFLPAACNFMICSNSEGNVVKIEPTDRRFVVFEKFDKKSSVYYDILFRALADKDVLRSFFDELKAISLEGFHPSRDRVLSEAYNDLKEMNVSKEQRFFEDWRRSKLLPDAGYHTSDEIYNEYRKWCKSVEFIKDDQMTKKLAFCKKLKRYAITQEHLVFCKTRRYNGYQVWQDFYYDNE